MTDKKTGGTDEDFDLNHFDQADETEREKANACVETEPFYADDLFADTGQPEQEAHAEKAGPFDTTGEIDRLAELSYGKKEPSIPQKPEPATASEQDAGEDQSDHGHDKHPETPDNEVEQPAITAPMPPMTDNHATTPPPVNPRSATKPITVFAVLAMLAAAIAVWLNPGVKSNSDNAISEKARPVLAADVQIRRLETRIASLEQLSSQHNDALHQQMEKLQQQLSGLSRLVAKQGSKPHLARHPITTAVKRKPPKSHAATTPVSTSLGGWVVNLVSLDSRHAAVKALEHYKSQGISAEIFPASVKGKMWYRLRIGGFASKQEAIVQKKYLASKYGIKDAWVQKP